MQGYNSHCYIHFMHIIVNLKQYEVYIRPVNCKQNGYESESYEATYCYAGPFLNILTKKMKRPNKHILNIKKLWSLNNKPRTI